MAGNDEEDAPVISNCRRRQFAQFAAVSGVEEDPVALERLVRVLEAILPRRTFRAALMKQAAQPAGGRASSRSTYASQSISSSVRSIGMSASPEA